MKYTKSNVFRSGIRDIIEVVMLVQNKAKGYLDSTTKYTNKTVYEQNSILFIINRGRVSFIYIHLNVPFRGTGLVCTATGRAPGSGRFMN